MATRMQQRRGTATQWTSSNDGDGPILNAGEIGWESDTNKFKIGDGISYWADLTYFVDATDVISSSLGAYLQDSDVGAVSGVAGLNASQNLLVPGTKIIFEGTDDVHETELVVTDPTSDVVLTFPNATGTIALASDITVSASSTNTFSNKSISLASNTVTGTTAEFNTALSDSNFVTTGDTGSVTSTMIADGTIVNADINASAAIAQSKVDGLTTDLAAKLALAGGTMTGAIAMGTNKITGLGTPTDSTDATTKAYVDAVTEGLHIHPSVVAATTENVTLASALENGDTLDGVTLATGNRILVKNQTTQSENGIYIVAASGAPSRATDFDAPAEIDGGDFVFVTGGTVNDNTGWVQTSIVGTVGTDAITFTQFSGAGTYTAGNGLTLTGSAFSINTSTTVDLNTAQTLTNKTLTSPVLTTPNLGTPSALTLTNATDLPLSTGISGFGTGVATFLATPSSANLLSAISDETGTGSLVFSTSPTLATPIITQAQSTPSFTSNAYTLVAGDAGKLLLASNSSTAGTINIPTDATTNFAVGTVITILQTGSGQLTITAATPGTTTLTSTGATAASPKCRVQNSAITIVKTAANTWYAMGDLS